MTVNRADFVTFIRGQRYLLPNGVVVTISAVDLPDNSTDIDNALTWALSIVADAVRDFDANLYALAVYNLAMHYLILYSSAVVFDALRNAWGLHTRTTGIVSSASDAGTSASVENPNFLKNMPLGDWQRYQTPNGRTYLGIVSDFNMLRAFM
jgi:type IV secretory pathway VirB6-like protein